jgi:hypothetical protein
LSALNNEKIRDVLDTVGKKGVLLLVDSLTGSWSLSAREALRQHSSTNRRM